MRQLRVERDGPKHIRLTGISPILLDSLFALPEIFAARDHPRVRQRLLPAPTEGDSQANRDWDEHVAPELRHLFVAAADTLLRDLAGLAVASPSPPRQLRFPAEHLPAWMSAVNQARLILGELFGVTETDMAREDLELEQARDRAILRIHVLGHLLHLFVELEGGGQPATPPARP